MGKSCIQNIRFIAIRIILAVRFSEGNDTRALQLQHLVPLLMVAATADTSSVSLPHWEVLFLTAIDRSAVRSLHGRLNIHDWNFGDCRKNYSNSGLKKRKIGKCVIQVQKVQSIKSFSGTLTMFGIN